MKKLNNEQRFNVINERRSGVTIKDLAQKYLLSTHGIKSILNAAGVVISPEQRQKNAYAEKIRKTPDAMKKMREKISSETIQQRNKSIQEAYQNPSLKQLKSSQFKKYWQDKKNSGWTSIYSPRCCG